MDGLKERDILNMNHYNRAYPPETLEQGRAWLQRRFNPPKSKLRNYNLKRIRAIFYRELIKLNRRSQ